MRRSLFPFVVAMAAVVAVVGCSSSGPEAGSSSTIGFQAGDPAGGVMPGYPTDTDALSPLVITAVAPDPIPVTGTDGRVHVAYELEVLNFSPWVATLTRLETLADGPDGEILAAVEGDALAARTVVVMDVPAGTNVVIPVGRTGLILVDDTYESAADVPASVTHRLSATFAPVDPGYEKLAALWPEESMSLIGGAVTTSVEAPVVIGPPLAGTDWLAGNGCCSYNNHRNVVLPIGGRINGSERFAVDWFRWDPADALDRLATGVLSTFRGDPTRNDDYLAYDEPVLAVADGTVVAVVSDVVDSVPPDLPSGIGLADLGGNLVVLDIGGGIYASYFHLAPGSSSVVVGDVVARGEVIGRLGNSGNSSEAHLHFQLQRTPAPLSGDNVPFVIDSFTYLGELDTTLGIVPGPDAGARTDQLPLVLSVVEFPELPR